MTNAAFFKSVIIFDPEPEDLSTFPNSISKLDSASLTVYQAVYKNSVERFLQGNFMTDYKHMRLLQYDTMSKTVNDRKKAHFQPYVIHIADGIDNFLNEMDERGVKKCARCAPLKTVISHEFLNFYRLGLQSKVKASIFPGKA